MVRFYRCAKKRRHFTCSPSGALLDLSDGTLVTELQVCLRQGQEADGVLAEHEAHLTKLAGDFIAV